MVGYATLFTQLPVFSLVLDRDVQGKTAMMYPELYKELTKGRSLSYKTFFIWVLVSIYQGSELRKKLENHFRMGYFFRRRYHVWCVVVV